MNKTIANLGITVGLFNFIFNWYAKKFRFGTETLKISDHISHGFFTSASVSFVVLGVAVVVKTFQKLRL